MAAGVAASDRLDAFGASLRIVDLVERAGARRLDVDAAAVRQLHAATAEAVAAVRDERRAEVDAGLGQLAVLVGRSKVAGQATGGVAATVVACARVAVEKAVLPFRIAIVSGNTGSERALVVVAWARALGIEAVREAVAVVVFAVRALRSAGRDDAAGAV